MRTNEQGDVILNIGANVSKAKTAINDLGRAVDGVFKAFKGQSVSSPQLDNLKAKAEQSVQKIKDLQQSIREMNESFSDKPTAQMQKFIDKETELEAKAKKIKEQITSTTPAPLAEKYSKQYDNIRSQIEQIVNQQLKLQENGKAFTTVAQEQPQAFAKANEQLRQEKSNLAGIKVEMADISATGSQAAGNVTRTFKSMGNTVASAFRKIKDHAKSSSNSAADSFSNIKGAVNKGVKSLLKYGLGIRSIFVLWRKLRSAVVDAYKDLTAFSPDVNKSVSSLKSAVSTLKNSVAAAVEPLITTFVPLVTSLVQKLTGLFTNIGSFFAALTGQKEMFKAVNVQEDYADSLNDTAKNADKAAKSMERYLSPLDDINRYTDSSTSGADTDATAATAKFTKTAVDDTFKNLAEKVNDYFSDIFKPIKTAWSKYGKPVMQEWKRLIDNVKGLISDVANSFRRVWTNGSGERVVGNILKLWKSRLRIINSIVDTFRNAWNKDMLGDSVIQSFIDRFNNLLELIRDVADTFTEVWNDGTGERIWTNILTTVRNINDIIGGFWKRIKKAWDQNDAGKRIWEGILGIVEDITGWLRDMSDITLDWVDDLNLSPIMEAVSGLVGAFRELAKVLLNKFKTAYRDVLLPLAKWTIEKAVPALIGLFTTALKVLSGVIKAIPVSLLTGLAAGITAVFVAVKAYKAVMSAWEFIKGLGVAFTNLWTAIMAHPYASAILAIVGAITAVVTSITVANKTKWETSDLKRSCDEINEYFDDVAEATENMKSALEDVNKSHIEIRADVSQVETLKDRLLKVIKDGIISEEEMPEYETIINLLNKVDGFEEMWNGMQLETIDGEIHINAEEATRQLEDFIEKWKLTQWQTALSSDFSTLYSSKGTSKRDISQAESELAKAKANLLEKIKETGVGSTYMQLGGNVFKDDWTLNDVDAWYNAYKSGKIQTGLLNSDLKEVADAYDNANTSLYEYQETYDGLTKSISDNWEAQKFLNGETENYVGALYAVDSGLISEADAFELLKNTGVDSYNKLKTLADIQMDEQINNNNAVKKSNEDVAENSKQKDLEILDSNKKAYGEIKESSFEFHTVQNKRADDTAANAQKNATTIERGYISAFSNIKSKAIELWDTVKGLFTNTDSIGKGIANLAITGINKLIDGVNSAIVTILNLVNSGFSSLRNFEIVGAKPFSWLPTITSYPQIPEIPALARGAVLPAGKPFLAMLGDQNNGRNLEAPEDLIRQIVREESRNSKGNSYTVPVYVSGKKLFEFILQEGAEYQYQTGNNPFVKVGG